MLLNLDFLIIQHLNAKFVSKNINCTCHNHNKEINLYKLVIIMNGDVDICFLKC